MGTIKFNQFQGIRGTTSPPFPELSLVFEVKQALSLSAGSASLFSGNINQFVWTANTLHKKTPHCII